MRGAWDDRQRISELVESVTLKAIASGTTTIVSGAESGESVHIFQIEVEANTPFSNADCIVNEVDASGNTIVLAQPEFQGESANNRNMRETWKYREDPDPMEPIRTLQDDALVNVRGTLSGAFNVTVWFWRDKM